MGTNPETNTAGLSPGKLLALVDYWHAIAVDDIHAANAMLESEACRILGITPEEWAAFAWQPLHITLGKGGK